MLNTLQHSGIDYGCVSELVSRVISYEYVQNVASVGDGNPVWGVHAPSCVLGWGSAHGHRRWESSGIVTRSGRPAVVDPLSVQRGLLASPLALESRYGTGLVTLVQGADHVHVGDSVIIPKHARV